MGKISNLYKKLFIGITLLFLFLGTNNSQTFAAFPRTPVPGIFTRDLTIFRTVNTLSCHPQNPLLHEVPHYVMYNATWNGSGACWAYHNEGNTNFLMVDKDAHGQPGSEDANKIRPASPTHHYMVIELPNPNYNAANEADCKTGKLNGLHCGKYVHWEGYSFMFEMAVDIRDKEVWYLKNFPGGYDIQGRNVSDVKPAGTVKLNSNGLPDPNGTSYTVYVGELVEAGLNGVTWKCNGGSTNDGPIRPGDKNHPCPNTRFDITDVSTPIFSNATLFSDIPHNRFTRNPRNKAAEGDSPAHTVREWFDDDDPMPDNDQLLDDHDDDWVKCQDNGTYEKLFGMSYRDYIKKFKKFIVDPIPNNIAVAPYTPTGCDYNPLNQDPGAVNGDPAAFPNDDTHRLSLTDKWLTSKVIANPTNTAMPSVEPSYLRSDFGGGPNGTKDGKVDLQDYNILVSEFRGGTTIFRANIITVGTSLNKVDIQDYNAFSTDYLTYRNH